MIITCKACNTSFNLDEKILKPEGSKVRCSVCSQVFTAYPKQAPVEAEETETANFVSQPTDSQQPAITESGVAEETASKIPDTDSDLDFSLEAEPEEDLDDSDIEDAVSDILDKVESGGQATSETDLDQTLDESDSIDDRDATIIADLDEEDLDFSLDIESSDEPDLDIDDELNLDLDLESDDEPDLDTDDELNLDLDLESDDDLDLDTDDGLNLDLDLDADDDLDLSIDLDAKDEDLDLQSDGDETIIADLDEEDLDLDLSSLDNLIEDDQANESTVIVEVDEDDELSSDVTDESESFQEIEADMPKESTEDFSLDLELDDLEEDTGGETSADEEAEVDLSEIEKMLEEPETGGSGSSLVPDQDTDLDLDIEPSLDNEKWMDDSAGEKMVVEDEVIDLSELEQVLDDVDVDAKDETVEEQELALEDALSSDADTGTDSADIEDDLELDLSEFEDDHQPQNTAGAIEQEADDMELEFEVEEDHRQTEKTLDDGELEETVVVSEPPFAEKSEAPTESVVEKAPSSPPVRKKSRKSLVFLLILIVLGGGGYGAYYWMTTHNVEIPFLSDYLKPKVNDPGNEKLTTEDINARFIDNTNVGKLFVITGKVTNGYEHSRGVITLSGKLFSSGKVLIAQEKVYCGNVMSDLELTNLDLEKIKARLANRLGDNRSNIKIEPGQSIPFMVVFSGLPEDLEEYTIEVIGSTVLK